MRHKVVPFPVPTAQPYEDQSYSIVIPFYNDFENLDLLLKDISTTCIRFRPSTIIIVDDGSSEKVSEWFSFRRSEYALPPVKILRIPNCGPAHATSVGLSKVESDYAFVIDSDIRLVVNTRGCKFTDVLSVCFWHTSLIKDVSALGCYLVDSYRDGLSYHGVISKSAHILSNGQLNEINRGYRIDPLLKLQLSFTDKVLSLSSSFYLLSMEAYREVGGFDDTFSPYGLYLSDFLARARDINYQSYITYETLAFHPKVSEKPEGSKAKFSEVSISEFEKKWSEHESWTEDSLYRTTHLRDIKSDMNPDEV